MSESPAVLALTTVESPDQAEDLARRLVNDGDAACVQIMPITSVYRWDGDIVSDAESLLLIKTTDAGWDRIVAKIDELHDYDTPELIRLDITDGAPRYLEWLRASVRDQGPQPPGSVPT